MMKFLRQKSLHDVLAVYGGALANGASLFLINLIVLRSLEQTTFAIFSLALLVVTTLAEMSDLGLNGGLSRFVPYYKHHGEDQKLKQLVKTIWKWRSWMAGILTIGGIVLAQPIAEVVFNQPALTPYLRLALLGIGGVIFLGFTSTYLKAVERFKLNAGVQTAKGVVRLIAIIVLVSAGITDLFVILSVYIVVPWLLFAFTAHVLPKGFLKATISKAEKKALHSQLAKFSFWLTIWSLSAILASRVDQIMLSNMLSLEDVALYAAAFQFVAAYGMLSQSISAVLLPKASRFTTGSEVKAFIRKAMKAIVPTIIVLSVLVYLSQYVFPLVFGDRYAASVPIYLVLSLAMVVGFLQIPYTFVPNIYNRTHIVAAAGFLQLITNVLGNLYFIPAYGVMGAAYTFVLGIAVSLLYNAIAVWYLLKYKQISVA